MSKIEKVVKSIYPLGDNFPEEKAFRRKLRALVELAFYQGQSTTGRGINSQLQQKNLRKCLGLFLNMVLMNRIG